MTAPEPLASDAAETAPERRLPASRDEWEVLLFASGYLSPPSGWDPSSGGRPPVADGQYREALYAAAADRNTAPGISSDFDRALHDEADAQFRASLADEVPGNRTEWEALLIADRYLPGSEEYDFGPPSDGQYRSALEAAAKDLVVFAGSEARPLNRFEQAVVAERDAQLALTGPPPTDAPAAQVVTSQRPAILDQRTEATPARAVSALELAARIAGGPAVPNGPGAARPAAATPPVGSDQTAARYQPPPTSTTGQTAGQRPPRR